MENEQNLNITKENNIINITPKSDIIFKNIFGNEQNKKLLESLLTAILREKVEVATVQKSKELDATNVNSKIGVLDVQATLKSGTLVNIEMQDRKYKNYNKRVLFYLAKMIIEQIKKSENYSNIKDVVLINIMGADIPNCKGIVSKYKINNVENICEKIEGVTIYFIQLPKFNKKVKELLKQNKKYEDIIKTTLDEWCVYFSYKYKELLKMVEVKNMDVKEALRLYEDLKERDDVMDLYIAKVLEERDSEAWKAKFKQALKENARVIQEKDKVTEEKNKVMEEKDKVIQEKNKVMEEKEVAIKEKEEKENTITQIIKNLLSQNLSKDVILNITGVSEERFEKAKLAFN